MKELKIFIIVVFIVGVVYWGVEPFAHSVMHPRVSPPNYNFPVEDITLAKSRVSEAQANLNTVKKTSKDKKQIISAEKSLENAKLEESKYAKFWAGINDINLVNGDPKKGKELLQASCTGCHGVKSAKIKAPMNAVDASITFGVEPPDLSDVGYLYDSKFLAALIKDPVMALKLDRRFNDEKPFPMTPFVGDGGNLNKEIADIVAYLKSIAPSKMSDEQVLKQACDRCHDMKYAKIIAPGDHDSIKKYLGSTPPDLSMMIRSRGSVFLHEFINDPQKIIPGTGMPRVGLNKIAEKQVVDFIGDVGDSKKGQRERTSIYTMIYFVILSILAYLFKRKVWAKLH